MRINLLSDYRGVLTNERYYLAGEYDTAVNMRQPDAEALVAAGRAELLEDTAVPAEPTAKAPVKRGKR